MWSLHRLSLSILISALCMSAGAFAQQVGWPVEGVSGFSVHDGPCKADWPQDDACTWLAETSEGGSIWVDKNPFQRYKSGYGFHLGADLNKVGDDGSRVLAFADGEIVKTVTNVPGWGNAILIKHRLDGSDYISVYAHVSWINNVQPTNGPVVKGDPIALVSNGKWTPCSPGKVCEYSPHLHFEIRMGTDITLDASTDAYTDIKIENGPFGTGPNSQVDPIAFIVRANAAQSTEPVSPSSIGASNWYAAPISIENLTNVSGTSLTAYTDVEVFSTDPLQWIGQPKPSPSGSLNKGAAVTVIDARIVGNGDVGKSDQFGDFVIYGCYHEVNACLTWNKGQYSLDTKVHFGLSRSETVSTEKQASAELWLQVTSEDGTSGWALFGSYKVLPSTLWDSERVIYHSASRLLSLGIPLETDTSADVFVRRAPTDSKQQELVDAFRGLVRRGYDINAATIGSYGQEQDRSEVAQTVTTTESPTLFDEFISLGMDLNSGPVCRGIAAGLNTSLMDGASTPKRLYFLNSLADNGVDVQCAGTNMFNVLGTYFVSAAYKEGFAKDVPEMTRALVGLGFSFRQKFSYEYAYERTPIEYFQVYSMADNSVKQAMLNLLRPLAQEEDRQISESSRQQVIELKRNAEFEAILGWERALSSKEPWPNTADLFRHDPGRTVSILSKGHKIVFKVNSIEFASGSVIAKGTQGYADIYAGIEKSALERLQDGSTSDYWGDWSTMISDVSSGYQGMYFTCQIDPDDAAILKEDVSYIFDAKLLNFSEGEYETRAIFECDVEGVAP